MRTKKEMEVYGLSQTLPPMSENQLEYAKRHSEKFTYTYYRKEYCSECGGMVKDGRCSVCGRKYSKKRHQRDRWLSFYYGIVTTCGGYQVLRHFIVRKSAGKGGMPTFTHYECFQNWLDEKGRETVVALTRRPFTFDGWIVGSGMKVKRRNGPYSPYDIGDYLLNPSMRTLPTLRRNGFRRVFYGLRPLELFRMLLTDNFAEMLVKTGRGHMLKEGLERLKPYARELAICHRNGYEIADASLWIDTMGMSRECGIDTRNPKYACPQDLKAAHDAVFTRLERKRAKERWKRDAEKISEFEAAYRRRKGRFFGLSISGDGIVITVLKSVRDVYDEGLAMHHCVFANGYYKKRESLLLTARNTAGERLETVEFDLDRGRVLQSRGVCNTLTEFHNDIVRLVEENAGQIMKMKVKRKAA